MSVAVTAERKRENLKFAFLLLEVMCFMILSPSAILCIKEIMLRPQWDIIWKSSGKFADSTANVVIIMLWFVADVLSKRTQRYYLFYFMIIL